MSKLPEKLKPGCEGYFDNYSDVVINQLIDYLQEREQPQEKLYTKAEILEILKNLQYENTGKYNSSYNDGFCKAINTLKEGL